MAARTRIKVCGITIYEDAAAAVAAGVDGLGFIFASRSPRYIEPDRAREIISRLPPFVAAVGVFVDEESSAVQEIARYCRLSVLQLHGAEPPEYCRAMPLPVIKAYRVGPDSPAGVLAPYGGCVQGFLLDTYHSGMAGGTGIAFDWGLVKKIAPPGPVILAGGLTPANVGEAIRQVRPYGVDVNSGIETEPGRKDIDKLQCFVKEVMKADRDQITEDI